MAGIFYLLIATISEVVGTTALKVSDGFSKLIPTTIVIVSYVLSFYLLSLSLKTIPLGISYAMWAGLGTALTVIIGIIVWKETMSMTTLMGLILIVTGVILLNIKGTAAR